ncbi:uncharacterized protein LOC129617684 [Condylostylus longicornis]|uniref:uncharacterized protein LOC129617684 n=1 Tax=Condylostylus longicornis TaxID=2530218 RepID=UPI00244DCEE3|nr:uncharacterized protein LOC129617684 [Condylostylus longicornis]
MSSTCWHVLGLLHRNKRDCNEAMQCFKQAVRLDPENLVLARDLTNLQVHEGNVCGNYQLAHRLLRTTIDHFQRFSESGGQTREEIWETGEREANTKKPSNHSRNAPSETSVLIGLLQSVCLLSSVPDKAARLETLGRLQIYTNRLDDAHRTFLELFRYQRANRTYLLCALASHPLFRNHVVFPKSPLAMRQNASAPCERTSDLNGNLDDSKFLAFSLYALGAPELHGSLANGWLAQPRHVIFRGTPRDFETRTPDSAMYYLLRPLSEEEQKRLSEWFLSDEETQTACIASRVAHQTICLSALSSFFDLTGQYKQALETVENAIASTPAFAELHQLKARILKHSGNFEAAAGAICDAREMDLADRFLNTLSVKYLLAIDDTKKATQMALYFSHEDNLTEMQSLSYELRCGESWRRQGKLGLSLNQFYTVVSQFGDMHHDLFDFHWYCQRRGGFRSYLRTLRMRNKVYAHRYYRRAVHNIISILLKQYDHPEDDASTTVKRPNNPEIQHSDSHSTATPEATSKSSKKKKKKADPSGASPAPPGSLPTATPSKNVDIDQGGMKWLLSGDAALEEAARLVDHLRQAAQLWPQTHQSAETVVDGTVSVSVVVDRKL